MASRALTSRRPPAARRSHVLGDDTDSIELLGVVGAPEALRGQKQSKRAEGFGGLVIARRDFVRI